MLELHDVQKSFGKTHIIRGVDLFVQQGERVAIIGPNGAGKSTLFNLMSGVEQASGGDILLKGQSLRGKSVHAINRMGLARSSQVSNLFGKLSVRENLRCAMMWSHGLHYSFWQFLAGQKKLNLEVNEWLNRLNLLNCSEEIASNLNYAEQRLLELGMTLASGANVILLDEPTAGISRDETHHFVQLIDRMTKGKTLLMVEHDMEVVLELADRIAVLEYGRIIALDTPQAIRANALVQRAYLGSIEAEEYQPGDALP